MVTAPLIMGLIGPIGWGELLIIGVFAVLIFGRRLPEVGRSLGQGLVEFKKGLKGVKDDVKDSTNEAKKIASDAEHDISRDESAG